jgi:Lrp/AsnC family transcriptional regulator for asnA, asnC and gidA
MGHHQLDELDYKILKLVASNARIPFLEVARECNVSGAAIHQRVQKLTNLGILKGSEYIIDSNLKSADNFSSVRFSPCL